MARVAIKSRPFHHAFGESILFVLCRVPVGTLVYHGTARAPSSCTVLCKVASLSGRRLIDRLITALRGLCPLVPCYARSRPCRDAGSSTVLSRHCVDSVLLYRVMQGRVPVGTLIWWLSCDGTARTLSSCIVLCKVSSLTGRWSGGCLITALRGPCPLVPCYARSRPCRDAGLVVVLSRHCEDSVLLYRVMQGLVPVGTGHDASMTADRTSDPADVPCPTHPYPAGAPCRAVGLDLQSRPLSIRICNPLRQCTVPKWHAWQ